MQGNFTGVYAALGNKETVVRFVFIAVNYNGSIHTENYLQSLQELILPEGDKLEAIVVDNKSTPDDLARVRESVSQRAFARLIPQDENPGYFKGLNAGIDTCEKDEDTLLVVGNNDLKFAQDFLLRLREISIAKDILVIAPNITTLDGRRQNPHVLKEVPLSELLMTRVYFSNYYIGQTGRYVNRSLRAFLKKFRTDQPKKAAAPEPGQMKIKRGIGACYILTPFFFKHHQRLDDRVFLWGEEALLSHQVESVGGYTLYDPNIKITHCESASVRHIEKRERYEIVKASYKIYRKYL